VELVVKIRNRTLIRFAAWLASRPFIALSKLLRMEIQCETSGTDISEPDAEQQFVYCLWHDQILFPLLRSAQVRSLLKTRRCVALVSQHQDGSVLTDFMENVGIHSVRGSSSRGGPQAMRQLIAEAEGSSIFITPDGPRGPRRHVKQGIVFLAAQTGRPIVPLGVACTRTWDFQGNWTNLLVPRPFSRLRIHAGNPITVPEQADRETLEQFRSLVESEMVRVEELARASLGLPPEHSRLSETAPQRAAA
jgi:lysophospholipid acyltransferase (LPLAT)-like uncharacterized protein